MVIRNGLVFQEDKSFQKQDLYIKNGILVDKADYFSDAGNLQYAEPINTIEAEGFFVIPGLIDIHSHGAVGEDFSDACLEGLIKILIYQYKHGVTSYCPTTMSLDSNSLLNVLRMMKNWKNKPDLSDIVGINMEGPFLDKWKKGAHKEDYLMNPNVDFFRKCNDESGKKIKLVTIAPNLENIDTFISELKNEVVISLGHTSADYETTKKAFQNGASHITHLYNAMNPMEHRNPGPIPAAAENNNCFAELICDGIHVHPSMIKVAFSLFPNRIVLISDSMRATGTEEGIYDLGGQKVHVTKIPLSYDKGNIVMKYIATLNDGTIAGSVSNLFDCMKYAISIGISPEEAIAAATMNPAKSIGIFDIVGSLTPGKKANILLLDSNFDLVRVIKPN